MGDLKDFKIREVDRKKQTFIEDWRGPSKGEREGIHYRLVDDAPPRILDRYYSGKSILVFRVGRDNDKDYEIIRK